jgi:membrane-bound serine protease (ClpP class)
MTVALLILFIGYLLIYAEFFLPGGLMGAVGGILLLVAIGVYAVESDGLLSIVAFTVGAGVGLAVVIRFALWRIRRAAPEHSVFLHSHQEGFVAASYDESLLEKEGSAATDLKPSGYIKVDGRRYQALSLSGYVKQGTEILVAGGKGAFLTVKPKKKDTP